MTSHNPKGAVRAWRIAAGLGVALTLGACSGYGQFGLLPEEDDVTAPVFESYQAVETAYGSVVAGKTQVSDLANFGFDASKAPNIEKLSYLGIMDRFMPGDSAKFDMLAPQVQTCIEAQDRCSAIVFRPQHIHAAREGSLVLDLLGFEQVTVESGWSAEVIFLMQDGRVVYKVISGRPRISEVRDHFQPLGPLQDLGDKVMSVGSHVKM